MSSPTVVAVGGGQRLGLLVTGALAGLVAALALGPLSTAATRAADDTPPEHSITVNGIGRVMLRPDRADLSLGVSIERPRAREAEVAAAEAMAKVIAALKAAGIAEADIQTSALSLQPVYDWSSSDKPRLTGYRMDHQLAVTIRDLTKVGTALDSAVDAGATTVNGIAFSVSDQAAAEQQARTAAMTDARAKADALARAGNISISSVISISEVASPAPVPYFYGAAEGDRAATPIQAGQVALTVTVTVVYAIG